MTGVGIDVDQMAAMVASVTPSAFGKMTPEQQASASEMVLSMAHILARHVLHAFALDLQRLKVLEIAERQSARIPDNVAGEFKAFIDR